MAVLSLVSEPVYLETLRTLELEKTILCKLSSWSLYGIAWDMNRHHFEYITVILGAIGAALKLGVVTCADQAGFSFVSCSGTPGSRLRFCARLFQLQTKNTVVMTAAAMFTAPSIR